MIAMNPYINLTDSAEEALNFYKGIFGGTLDISRFGDMADRMPTPVAEEHKDLIMHGVLKTDDLQLMVSDSAPMGPSTSDSNISISLSGDDDATLTKYYESLSEGGKVTVPLEKAPWGDKFGMLTDKFGVAWMVNVSGSTAS